MSKTTRKAKPRQQPPEVLARELVEARLASLVHDHWDFISPGSLEEDQATRLWELLTEAVERRDHPELSAEVYAALQRGSDSAVAGSQYNYLLAAQESYATAGFLVGVELGRRIGGAR